MLPNLGRKCVSLDFSATVNWSGVLISNWKNTSTWTTWHIRKSKYQTFTGVKRKEMAQGKCFSGRSCLGECRAVAAPGSAQGPGPAMPAMPAHAACTVCRPSPAPCTALTHSPASALAVHPDMSQPSQNSTEPLWERMAFVLSTKDRLHLRNSCSHSELGWVLEFQLNASSQARRSR